jgi:hypothetical protein
MRLLLSAGLATATLATMTAHGFAQDAKPTHEVARDEICYENVPSSTSKTWRIARGSRVTKIRDEGSYTRIKPSSDPECSIATDALKAL